MTSVAIQGEKFYIDGKPTYQGRDYLGYSIEGLLMNSRMVQATFDDENPETRSRWAYPDTGEWDAERNMSEFLAALPVYYKYGLRAITVNMQGGSPEGYSKGQPWINTGFTARGSLKPDYISRLKRVLDTTDKLGMVVILGLFYFGQDEYLADEATVCRAVDNAAHWVLDQRYEHVLLEINNECDVARYEHDILKPPRVHELIERAKAITHEGRRMLVGTSYKGNTVPDDNVIAASDFLLLHGNGVSDPNRIAEMVEQTRAKAAYRPMPIVFNEDDHFDFDKPLNNCLAAISRGASWGYFDPGESNYRDGYQCPPVNWGLSTERKQAFFEYVRAITGVGRAEEE